MYKVGKEFLTQDKEAKIKHLDPKEENTGYVDIEGTRDFIKVIHTLPLPPYILPLPPYILPIFPIL
jgi:hypothetical protein